MARSQELAKNTRQRGLIGNRCRRRRRSVPFIIVDEHDRVLPIRCIDL